MQQQENWECTEWSFVQQLCGLQPLCGYKSHVEIKVKKKNEDLVNQFYSYTQSKYAEYLQVFTDGSKDQRDRTGSAFAVPEHGFGLCKRTSDSSSVYSAELYDIWMALERVEQTRPRKILICSDSTSGLTSLKLGISSTQKDLVMEIMEIHSHIIKQGITVTFIWVPAHMGI